MSLKSLGMGVAYRRNHFFALIGSLCVSITSWSDPLALLYPEVREPYQKVFLNIAEGAEKELGQNLKHLVINKKMASEETQHWLVENEISAVIALGNHSLKALGLGTDLPFVAGAITQKGEENKIYGISLNPAPNLLFEGLLDLTPNISTIHVVFDKARNQWEVSQATAIAKTMNITIKSYPVTDLREAAVAYRDIQDRMDAETDALWLPLGGPARDKSMMQNILENAWVNEQVVFSSNLADVKRGVLFAMYPNNIGMGKELGSMLRKIIAGEPPTPTFHFATSLYKAVNRRTAEHLQLKLGNQELSKYEFIYPPR